MKFGLGQKSFKRRQESLFSLKLLKNTRDALVDWITFKELDVYDWLFPSRKNKDNPMTTRQYGRVVKNGLNQLIYRNHLTLLIRYGEPRLL